MLPYARRSDFLILDNKFELIICIIHGIFTIVRTFVHSLGLIMCHQLPFQSETRIRILECLLLLKALDFAQFYIAVKTVIKIYDPSYRLSLFMILNTCFLSSFTFYKLHQRLDRRIDTWVVSPITYIIEGCLLIVYKFVRSKELFLRIFRILGLNKRLTKAYYYRRKLSLFVELDFIYNSVNLYMVSTFHDVKTPNLEVLYGVLSFVSNVLTTINISKEDMTQRVTSIILSSLGLLVSFIMLVCKLISYFDKSDPFNNWMMICINIDLLVFNVGILHYSIRDYFHFGSGLKTYNLSSYKIKL